jgi:MbtH protein
MTHARGYCRQRSKSCHDDVVAAAMWWLQRRSSMTNPFDDDEAVFHALVNDEGQYSLWPAFVQIPQGWNAVLESAKRSACLARIEELWADMRPLSLVRAERNGNDVAASAARHTPSNLHIPRTTAEAPAAERPLEPT